MLAQTDHLLARWVFIATLAAIAHTSASPSPRAAFETDIAIYDRVLARVQPGQTTVRFGDVGVTVEQLRAFRERLADAAARAEGGEPDVITPAGTAFKWPGGLVYYRFNPSQVTSGTITAGKMQQFRDGAAEWAGWANLTFVENITGQANFITVSENPGLGGGYSSSVGMAGGEQLVEFGPFAWNRGTIGHEVGHALGLWHEQQRPDRDTYVTINWDNIPNGENEDEPNFVIIPAGTVHGAYDFFSVMHYERNALAIDPNIDTILMKPGFEPFANAIGRIFFRTLSKLDRAGMAAIYGNPTPLPSAVVTNTRDSGRGSLRNAIYYAFDRATDAPAVPTTVVFNIPTTDPAFAGGVFTIRPTFLLTAPGAGTTIDGGTQTAFTGNTNAAGPEIVLDGSRLTSDGLNLFAPGLLLFEANCTVRSLVINSFNQQGISLTGNGNVISGCYVGTNATGTSAVPNAFSGIELFGGASGNTVGGSSGGARNLVSGNASFGVALYGATTQNNVIAGNYIGTNAAGTGAVPNANSGVAAFSAAHHNTIGGTAPGARNVISGNKQQGVVFAGAGTNANTVLGNFIGTDVAGTSALPNGFFDTENDIYLAGVSIFGGAQSNVIGGLAPGARNLLSGNAADGVSISGAGTSGNVVLGNLIGTDVTGLNALGNGFAEPPAFRFAGASFFNGASGNTIGGDAPGASNVISGNAGVGVFIGDSGTDANVVRGNFIGTNITGTSALGNGFAGVGIFSSAKSNVIGGTTPGARNLISGNNQQGVAIFYAGTSNNQVLGNYIGTDASGLVALGNGFGNPPVTYSGVDIFDAPSNQIGGPAGARNIIGGSSDSGVVISGAAATGNKVQGNTIGRNATNTGSIPNGFAGVVFFGGANSNLIGGTTPGLSNLIAGNTYEGIFLGDPGTIRNAIHGNSITDNGGAGILLFDNANANQPAPALSSASLDTATHAQGSLTAGANTTYRIEFFSSPEPDLSGFGEGRSYLGFHDLAIGGSGNASFNVTLPAIAPAGHVLAATATDPLGNTSAFSNALAVTSTDTDGDGIPDAYETANGLNPNVNDAALDADGDGQTNGAEFRAGTNPQNGASRFTITAVTRSAGNFGLTFTSLAGKTYRIEFKNDLLSPDWILLSDQVFATGGSTSIDDPGAGVLPRRFYRVSIEP